MPQHEFADRCDNEDILFFFLCMTTYAFSCVVRIESLNGEDLRVEKRKRVDGTLKKKNIPLMKMVTSNLHN